MGSSLFDALGQVQPQYYLNTEHGATRSPCCGNLISTLHLMLVRPIYDPQRLFMNKAEPKPVDAIVLDKSNPRIKHYMEMYTVLNDEHMLLALGAGAENEGGSTAEGSYQRLKHSIRASEGIIQSIIVFYSGQLVV